MRDDDMKLQEVLVVKPDGNGGVNVERHVLDQLCRRLDMMMHDGEWHRLNSILSAWEVDRKSIDETILVLVTTYPGRNNLPAREQLKQRLAAMNWPEANEALRLLH